jgi:hypothetical protein
VQPSCKRPRGAPHLTVGEPTLAIPIVVNEERAISANQVFEEVEQRVPRHATNCMM